jgi:diadenosine tetraphosphate (Ap4A) HIT family hydrolase
MIHKNEQILPADYAEGLRNLVANQGQGGSGSDTHNHLHVHAVDAKGVAAFFQKHQSSLFKTFQNGMRTGRAWGSGGDPRR